MPHISFKLLVRASDRHPTHHVQPHLHACKFLFPDDGPPMYSVPAASEYEAVNNLFEADAGRPLATPAGNFFVPLADAVLRLGEAFAGRAEDYMSVLSYDDWLNERLLERAAEGCWPTDKAVEVYRLLHAVLTSIQGIVTDVCHILTLLRDIRTDPNEGTMQGHPLTDYADYAVARAMCWCRATLVELGIPDAITRSNLLTFNVDFDLTPEREGEERWPSQQAFLFIEQRDARLRNYLKQMAALKARASREDALRVRIDAMLSEGADIYAQRIDAESPTGASGLEKFLAVTRKTGRPFTDPRRGLPRHPERSQCRSLCLGCETPPGRSLWAYNL